MSDEHRRAMCVAVCGRVEFKEAKNSAGDLVWADALTLDSGPGDRVVDLGTLLGALNENHRRAIMGCDVRISIEILARNDGSGTMNDTKHDAEVMAAARAASVAGHAALAESEARDVLNIDEIAIRSRDLESAVLHYPHGGGTVRAEKALWLAARVPGLLKEIDGRGAAIVEAGRLIKQADAEIATLRAEVDRLTKDRKRLRAGIDVAREQLVTDMTSTAYATLGAL